MALRSFLLAALIAHSGSAAATLPAPIFRIVHTSPRELLSALQHAPVGARASSGGDSRLLSYFKVVRKEVSGANVKMTVQLDARYFPSEMTKYGQVVVDMREREVSAEKHVFAVSFAAPMAEIAGDMVMTPYGNGETLLKYTVTRTNMPDWVVQRFVDVATRLNLASSTPISQKR